MTLDIEKFTPGIAELHSLVETTKLANLPDLRDTAQVKVIKSYRIQLRDARVAISKRGKELRDDAIKFQKLVLSREKELIGIIEPEEARLKGLEDQAEELAEMDKRQADLPKMRAVLEAIKDGMEISDEELLKMDEIAFGAYSNKRIADQNEKARLDLERRERKVKDKELEQQREKEKAEAEERGRVKERERLEREQADKEARQAREKKEAEERLERERLDKERKEREEKERLERDTKYQMFLSAQGIDTPLPRLKTFAELLSGGDNFLERITKDAKGVVRSILYKKIGTLEL